MLDSECLASNTRMNFCGAPFQVPIARAQEPTPAPLQALLTKGRVRVLALWEALGWWEGVVEHTRNPDCTITAPLA